MIVRVEMAVTTVSHRSSSTNCLGSRRLCKSGNYRFHKRKITSQPPMRMSSLSMLLSTYLLNNNTMAAAVQRTKAKKQSKDKDRSLFLFQK